MERVKNANITVSKETMAYLKRLQDLDNQYNATCEALAIEMKVDKSECKVGREFHKSQKTMRGILSHSISELITVVTEI